MRYKPASTSSCMNTHMTGSSRTGVQGCSRSGDSPWNLVCSANWDSPHISVSRWRYLGRSPTRQCCRRCGYFPISEEILVVMGKQVTHDKIGNLYVVLVRTFINLCLYNKLFWGARIRGVVFSRFRKILYLLIFFYPKIKFIQTLQNCVSVFIKHILLPFSLFQKCRLTFQKWDIIKEFPLGQWGKISNPSVGNL